MEQSISLRGSPQLPIALVVEVDDNYAATVSVPGYEPHKSDRAAARAFIERRLSDPRLSATMIADAVGISARHLSRVFANDGTSVPKHILRRRLNLAHSLLTKPGSTSMTVAEIAHHCGFASAAHFSNAFVAQYDERASDVRRQAAAARSLTTDA